MMQKLKTGKRLCSLFLSLCLLCTLFVAVPVEAAETLTSGNWEYVILTDGTVEITGYKGNETKVAIPDKIAGKSVTSIGEYAFKECSSLTNVEIPSGVTEIGGFAFYGCRSLTSIELPSSVTKIGVAAFNTCSSLTSIEIPSGVTEIGGSVFSGCSSLMSVNVAEDSKTYTSKDGILYDKSCETLLRCPEGKQGTITIPSGVTKIGASAFVGCSNIMSIEIPGSVTEIDINAFKGCSSITGIEIPSGVTSIGVYAFESCSSLKSIDIPNSVTRIGHGAFSRCSSLSDITIPSSVTSIGDSAFYGCSFDLTIYAEPGSYAEGYVKEKGMEFKCLSHTPETDPAKAPTCTATGKTAGSHCSICGEIIQAQNNILATGHTYKKTIQKATTKKNGLIEEKCSACGHVQSTTEINAASDIKLSKTSFTYNGKNKKPAVTVKDSKGNKLPAGSYKITRPKTSKKVGKYTVTITLQGNYSGTVKLTYQITPKGTSISKLNAKKKGFTAKWKKQTKQTTGYQLQYSTSKKFKGAKTVTVKKNKTISKSVKKLKAGKKYYVRIRTYKTVKIKGKNVKICSGWSKVKSVKTKK